MKRAGKQLRKVLLDDKNIEFAIDEVNKGHRWLPSHKPNLTVLWVEVTKPYRIQQLKQIILNGFEPIKPVVKKRYDKNAKKWRDIAQPLLWPDQYIHHILVQAIQPVLERGMDFHCCGSIPTKGAYFGYWHIKKWMRQDPEGTRWCLEADIHHFYNNLKPEEIMKRMKQLIKDWLVLDLIERCMKFGVLIGAYFSQWFANTFLQPLDQLIRSCGVSHYIRYLDNFTIFSNSKRTLYKVLNLIKEWLKNHQLIIKDNWQYFRTSKRLPNALGYRYGKNYVLIRKLRLLNIKKQIRSYYRQKKQVSKRFAQGMISRLGGLRHCNAQNIYKKYVPNGLQKEMKDIIRRETDKEMNQWNTFLEQYLEMAQRLKTLKLSEVKALRI